MISISGVNELGWRLKYKELGIFGMISTFKALKPLIIWLSYLTMWLELVINYAYWLSYTMASCKMGQSDARSSWLSGQDDDTEHGLLSVQCLHAQSLLSLNHVLFLWNLSCTFFRELYIWCEAYTIWNRFSKLLILVWRKSWQSKSWKHLDTLGLNWREKGWIRSYQCLRLNRW